MDSDLEVTLFEPGQERSAAATFHRDGFVCLAGALTEAQLAAARDGANRVVAEQTAAVPLEKANRGYARYSFGPQLHHREWAGLIALPTVLPVLDAIWRSPHYICSGGGGDYSLPGAQIQHLHADVRDVLDDPEGRVHTMDLPSPYIVVNFLLTDFSVTTGGTRFVRGTHRTRLAPPSLDEEPAWMKRAVLCAPAGTALVRDVRCWHGGTANRSDRPRIMVSTGYNAPWFRLPNTAPQVPQALYDTLPPRARELARFIVMD